MRVLVAAAMLLLLLSGCSGKDLSEEEMRERADAALSGLESDIGVGGRASGFRMTGSVTIEAPTPAGVFPLTVQAEATVAFGPGGEVRVEGRVASVEYSVYCDPDRVVVVTDGFEQYGERDESLEVRNAARVCTGRDAEPLLGGLGDLDFADPALLTGHFDPGALQFVGVEKTGKGTFDAVYRSAGAAGASDITVHMRGRDIQSFTVENPESRLNLEPVHGERTAQSAPEAEQRFAGPVRGDAEVGSAGYGFTVTSGSGGALSDYSVRVLDGDATAGCTGGPAPVASFDLGAGDVQEEAGYRLTFQDDGDGRLGAGDWFLVEHPGRGNQPFGDQVVVWDDWADAGTGPGCSVPGPGAGLGLLAVLGALGAALRRR